jgi:hypothetical protein
MREDAADETATGDASAGRTDADGERYGDPIAYSAVTKGTPVLSASGAEFARVEHVLQDPDLDLFDGIAVRTDEGLRFVDAGQVAGITSGAVQTTIADTETDALPKPDGDPVFDVDPEEYQGNGLSSWFGRMFMREHWTRDRD